MDIKEPYFSLSTGIQAAKSDARHDFDKTDKTQELVNLELPESDLKYNIKPTDEDGFIEKYLLKEGIEAREIKAQKDDENEKQIERINSSILKDEISEYYDIYAYRNDKKEDKEEKGDELDVDTSSIKHSQLQSVLKQMGVMKDVFIICDVAKSWIRTDLKKAERGEGKQIFWWCQTTQTDFDPATKTSWHSKTGKQSGFQDNKSNFKFCWNAVTDGDRPSKIYTAWDLTKESIGINDEKSMLCLNKDLFMTTKVENKKNWDYDSHKSYLMINDKAKNKWVYVDKGMAAKKSSMSSDKISSYKKNSNSIWRELFESIVGGSEEPLLDTYADRYHILAKRCGDMPQALNCLDNNMRFQTFINAQEGPSPTNVGIPKELQNGRIILDKGNEDGLNGIFQTNGNNMFVSFDKIAAVQAVNYRVPLVFYDQGIGYVLFVAKHLKTKLNKLESVLVKSDVSVEDKIVYKTVEDGIDKEYYFETDTLISNNEEELNNNIGEFNANLTKLSEIVADINEFAEEVRNRLVALNELNNDKDVNLFLKEYLKHLIPLNMLVDIQDVVNGTRLIIEKYNNEFKNFTELDKNVISGELSIDTFKEGIKNLFANYVVDGELKDGAENTNESNRLNQFIEKAMMMQTFILSRANKMRYYNAVFEGLKEKYSNYENYQIPKNLTKTFGKGIHPYHAPRRSQLDQKEKYVEEYFKIDGIFTPLIDCLSGINSSEETSLSDISIDFKTKVLGLFETVSPPKATPEIIPNVENYNDVYKAVAASAKEKITKLLEKINDKNMQDGGNQKRDRDGNIIYKDTADLANQISFAYNLVEEVDEKGSNFDAKTLTSKDLNMLINFDEFLKLMFKILSYYYYDLKLNKNEIDTESSMFKFYSRIGREYIDIENAPSDIDNEDYDEEDDDKDLYLVNTFKTSIDTSVTTLFSQNIVKFFYMYLNQKDNDGPYLYPDYADDLDVFSEMAMSYFNELNEIKDYSKLRQVLELLEEQTPVYQPDEDKNDFQQKRVNRQETPTEDEMNVDGKTETVVVGTQPLYSPIETPTSASSSSALMEVDKRSDIPSNDNPFATPKSTGGKKTRKRGGKKRSIRKRLINDIKQKNSRRKNKVKSNN